MRSKMLARFRPRSVYDVMTLLLTLGALSTGTALAANTIFSGDIVNDQVYSEDVRNDALSGGGLVAADLQANSVGSSEVRNDNLTSPAGGLVAADLRAGSVGSSEAADNSLTGTDINELTLDRSSFPAGVAREYGPDSCNDDAHISGGENCGSVSVTLARSGNVLLLASGYAYVSRLDDLVGPGSETDDPGTVEGRCGISHTGADFPPAMANMKFSTYGVYPFAITDLNDFALGAGTHTFTVRCRETDGDIDWNLRNLTALVVGPSPVEPTAPAQP